MKWSLHPYLQTKQLRLLEIKQFTKVAWLASQWGWDARSVLGAATMPPGPVAVTCVSLRQYTCEHLSYYDTEGLYSTEGKFRLQSQTAWA